MTERTLDICDPCRSPEGNHHMECAGNKDRPCECLVCAGEKIGDEVMGDAGGNVPKHGRLRDRFDPQPWRP